MTVSRRGFLRGALRAEPSPLRPPWAIAPGAFEQTCTRCGACVEACRPAILKHGDGGYPRVDFDVAGCTFCTDCASACLPRALSMDGRLPWRIHAAASDACLARRGVECRICGEACEAAAIRFRPRPGGIPVPEILVDACSGCGACVAPCPSDAIAMESER